MVGLVCIAVSRSFNEGLLSEACFVSVLLKPQLKNPSLKLCENAPLRDVLQLCQYPITRCLQSPQPRSHGTTIMVIKELL